MAVGDRQFIRDVLAGRREFPQVALSVKQFGAVGNGSVDDSAAIQHWIDYIVDNNLAGYAPPGTYLLNSAVTKSASSPLFKIFGAGRGVTIFQTPSTNTTGALLFTDTGRGGQAHFADFTIETEADGGGVGLQYTQPEGGNQHQRAVICENVTVRGANGTSDYFDTFIDFTGSWRPLLTNTVVSGPWVGVGLADSSATFDATYGINLTGCYDPTVRDCYVWGASTMIEANVYQGSITGVTDNGDGTVRVTVSNAHPFSNGTSIIIVGTTDYNGTFTMSAVNSTSFDITDTYVSSQTGTVYAASGPEGFRMFGTILGSGRIGLNLVRPAGREPFVQIDNCHVNFRDEGLKFDGARFVTISETLFYNEDSGEEYSGTPYDIDLVNVSDYHITNNQFHQTGHTGRINVNIQTSASGAGDRGTVSGNQFNATAAYAVQIGSAAGDVVVGPNEYTGTFGTGRVNDLSSVANVHYPPLRYVSGAAASHTGDTSETTLATIVIPGGSMGANGYIKVNVIHSHTSSANNKTLIAKFGGTGGTAYDNRTIKTSAYSDKQFIIRNRNDEASQIGFQANSASGLGSGAGAATSTQDTSGNVSLLLRGTLANSSETITLEHYVVEVQYVE